MKLTLRRDGGRRGRALYLFWGRVRVSTVALIVAFFATWWLYATYQPPAPVSPQEQAPVVVPPGFVPDPEYTWVPRTNVEQRPLTTTPTTTTPTETTSAPSETTPTDTESPTPVDGEPTTVIDPDGPGPLPPTTLAPGSSPGATPSTIPTTPPAPTTPGPLVPQR